MSGLAATLRNAPRSLGPLLIVVLLQVGLVFFSMTASAEDTFGIILAGLMGAPFLLVALLIRPAVALFAVPILLIVPGWLFGFTFAELLLLAVVFLGVFRLLVSGNLPARPVAAEWVFALFAIWAALTLLQAVDLRIGVIAYKRVPVLFLTFVAGRRLLGGHHALDLVRVVAILGSLIAFELLVVVLGAGLPLAALVTRAGALTNLGWGYSNYVAAVAALTTAAGIPLVLHGKAGDRFLGVAGLVAAVLVSIATVSRGGTLAIVMGLIVALGFEAKRRFLLSFGLLVMMASAYLFSPLGQASLARFVQPSELPSVTARIVFYQESLRILGENLLLGVGPDQIPFHTPIEVGPHPHNFLLKFAVDYGIPGLLLYLALLGILVAKARTLYRRATDRRGRILGLTFALLLVMGITNALYEPTIEELVFGGVFWMMAGALVAASETEPAPGEPRG